MERYEMLTRLARSSQLSSTKQEEVEEESERKPKTLETIMNAKSIVKQEEVEKEAERKPMTLDTIMNAIKGSDREYASKILKLVDPSLWDDAGVLKGLDIPVQDFVLDLKNAENYPPLSITAKRRRAIKHFIYKHTDIKPSMILNHKYVPYVKPVQRSVAEPVKTSRIVKPVKITNTPFKWLERR